MTFLLRSAGFFELATPLCPEFFVRNEGKRLRALQTRVSGTDGKYGLGKRSISRREYPSLTIQGISCLEKSI